MISAFCAAAHDQTLLARVDPTTSAISEDWRGQTEVRIGLSQGVPFRVFVLQEPDRLVVDFAEADWTAVQSEALLGEVDAIEAVRFGAFRPGWSRLVADLRQPMLPTDVAMPIDPSNGQAVLSFTLSPVDRTAFAAAAGAPVSPVWETALAPIPHRAPGAANRFTVALDPGHGGFDPGAERDGTNEKELMLTFARALREALIRQGIDVVLTRDADSFVSLPLRVAIAHRGHADILISLHADYLSDGGARGAAIYTLSPEASKSATAFLSARHKRDDLITGADLSAVDDQITGVLLDLARQETEPRAKSLARALVDGMAAAGGPMNNRPLREGGFSVLKSADIPSVLVEFGFLSSDRDLKNLRDPIWRAGIVQAMTKAILEWRDADEARSALVRR